MRLAQRKARHGAHPESARVIGADTLVALDNCILGKPHGLDDAAEMLHQLRGRGHRVITGVTVVSGSRAWVDKAVTRVRMRPYADEELEAFVATGASLDKAGAYAVQDADFRPVECLEGCYCNVVGLPLGLLLRLLRKAGYPAEQAPQPAQCAGCPDWR